jgi:dihydrofolate reductase
MPRVLAGMTVSLDGYFTAGQVDEFTLTVAPVLLGAGKRLFDGISRADIAFERAAVIESPFATHLRFHVGSGA